MKPEMMEKLLDIILAFHQESDYYKLLDIIMTKMMEFTNADGGTLYVVENDKLCFRIMKTISLGVYQGGRDKIDLPPIALDENNIENISAYVAIKNEMVLVDDVYNNNKFNFSGPRNYDQMTGYHTRSMLVFPLTTTSIDNLSREVIGVIQLINAIDEKTGQPRSFEHEDYDPVILLALANISANSLANLTFSKEVKELFDSFVRVMSKAIDERSPYTVNHTNNVARYCGAFAEYLKTIYPHGHKYNLNTNRSEQLVMAALLHDIGKVITPLDVMDKPDRLGDRLEIVQLKFEIKRQQLENSYNKKEITEAEYQAASQELQEALNQVLIINDAGFLSDAQVAQVQKLATLNYLNEAGALTPLLTPANLEALSIRKGTLTEKERQIMQEHVSITGRLLDQITFNKCYSKVPVFAQTHHEFLDGSGYPKGLNKDQLDIETCILSIMDIFDALVAARPYKNALPPEKSIKILTEMAENGQLHPELVQLFIQSKIWQT